MWWTATTLRRISFPREALPSESCAPCLRLSTTPDWGQEPPGEAQGRPNELSDGISTHKISYQYNFGYYIIAGLLLLPALVRVRRAPKASQKCSVLLNSVARFVPHCSIGKNGPIISSRVGASLLRSVGLSLQSVRRWTESQIALFIGGWSSWNRSCSWKKRWQGQTTKISEENSGDKALFLV